MEIPIVPVIIKQRNKDGGVDTVGVKNLFAVPVLLWQHDHEQADTLAYEQRVATMINQHMHLLTLSPDREPGQIVYETFISPVEHTIDAPGEDTPENREPVTHVGRGGVSLSLGAGAHDKHDVQGDAGSPQDPSAVPGPDNGGGEQASGGDETPNSEAVHSPSGEAK